MKKLAVLFSLFALCSFADLKNPITEKERKFASDFLSSTEKNLLQTVKGLSKAQLQYKAAPDKWSIEDCMKHIAISEQGLWHMTDSVINSAANPEKRTEIKATDEQVIQMISDRTHKAKAPEQIQPQNTPYQSFKEALESFKTSNRNMIKYVKETDKELRDHVTVTPAGPLDTYQMILFIGAHTQRHTKQMEEVKADPGFPKK